MATVSVTATAGRDTRKILQRLVDNGGFASAQAFASAIVALHDRLGAFSRTYAVRPSLGVAVRVAVIAPYLVLYRHDEHADRVILLRVVHGSRRITDALLKKP